MSMVLKAVYFVNFCETVARFFGKVQEHFEFENIYETSFNLFCAKFLRFKSIKLAYPRRQDLEGMEVDQFATEMHTGEVSRLPLIDESSAFGIQAPKDRLIAILDQVEMRVERLRRDTVRIEEERDSLLATLDSIKHSELLGDVSECDKDDIIRYTDRIQARAMTVQVAVRTDRDAQQEEALHQVNMYIDQLVMAVQDDAVLAYTRCQTFMNACSSQPDSSTGTDKNFELAILGCTLDDQKKVKKRLQGLLDYLSKLNVTTCS